MTSRCETSRFYGLPAGPDNSHTMDGVPTTGVEILDYQATFTAFCVTGPYLCTSQIQFDAAFLKLFRFLIRLKVMLKSAADRKSVV